MQHYGRTAMGVNPFPNPAFDVIDNATDFVVYAMRQGFNQSSVDARIDQLARFLEFQS